jgi:hypothetical protein
MGSIGDVTPGLEKRGAKFTVESLAKELPQEWVEEALREAGCESVRVRLLPAPLTMWGGDPDGTSSENVVREPARETARDVVDARALVS